MKITKRSLARRAPAGFTLIELVITVAIVALLATAAAPVAEMVTQRIKEQDLRRALHQIRDGIDAYKRASDDGRVTKSLDESGYPKSLQQLVEGVQDQKSPSKDKIYFLRRVPRDPFNADASLPAESTWGKRSYASPADAPQEGRDVFDVYSMASGMGINGRPYKEW
jgi:general secretion pathway protein G